MLGEIKRKAGCHDCGFSAHAVALDFHHVGEKRLTVSKAACAGMALWRLMREIDQCIVLCANCHRIRHASE